jgi:hypothetical protein
VGRKRGTTDDNLEASKKWLAKIFHKMVRIFGVLTRPIVRFMKDKKAHETTELSKKKGFPQGASEYCHKFATRRMAQINNHLF